VSLALPEALFFVGIDWATEIHAVCVLDPGGRQIATFPVAHTADGLGRLTAALARLGDPAGIPVAIERPNGRLVDVLLEAGHPVVPVSPNAIKTWRDGEVLSGAKSDLLTELGGGFWRVSGRVGVWVPTVADRDRRRGCAAGSVAAGGAAARVA